MKRDAHKLGNLSNYQTMPFIENYRGTYYQKVQEYGDNGRPTGKPYIDTVGIEFRFADGTSDSYVKRGYDEELLEMLDRYESIESAWRIFTTDMRIDFKPGDIIYIGADKKKIVKVLPLMNLNDNLRKYNYQPGIYRQMAPKLIYLK